MSPETIWTPYPEWKVCQLMFRDLLRCGLAGVWQHLRPSGLGGVRYLRVSMLGLGTLVAGVQAIRRFVVDRRLAAALPCYYLLPFLSRHLLLPLIDRLIECEWENGSYRINGLLSAHAPCRRKGSAWAAFGDLSFALNL